MRSPFGSYSLAVWALAAIGWGSARAANNPGEVTRFPDSILAVDGGNFGARITRTTLTAAELSAPMTASVSLRMRNYSELLARIASGEVLSHAELEARYLPDASQYAAVRGWLAEQGLAISLDDSNHTTVWATADAARISRVFGVSLARVATVDGAFTSAVSAPALPRAISSEVLCVDGLQPHLRAHHPRLEPAPAAAPPSAGVIASPNGNPTPAGILTAYNAPSQFNGQGQTIAIVGDGNPLPSDLTQFWSTCGIAQSLANYTVVPVDGGAPPDSQGGDSLELTLDVSWASGIASGAKIRLYAIPNSYYVEWNRALVRIINDLPSIPGMNQVSFSFAGLESGAGTSAALASYSQTYAQLVASGVTVFTCAGDGGSNPNPAELDTYLATASVMTMYPASDPLIVAVGGTEMTLGSDGSRLSEASWFVTTLDGNLQSGGGGISTRFTRPSWQSGAGVPAGNMRCVPDISEHANKLFTVFQGLDTYFRGTSFSTPIWAGFCALINQARAAAGSKPIGALGPRVYPLIGTPAFFDITTGNNGVYSAGPGYDCSTGIGTPNFAALFAILVSPSTFSSSFEGVSITAPAPGAAVPAGSPVTLAATAVVNMAYQWLLNGTAIPGATGATYSPGSVLGSASAAGTADSGHYVLVLTDGVNYAVLDAGTLTVTSDARLINLSARANAGAGSSVLIAGFGISGSADKQVLLRGVGPGLSTTFALANTLASPVLTLFDSGQPAAKVIATDAGWGNAPSMGNSPVPATVQPATNSLMTALGAFALATGSADDAVLAALPASNYTVWVAGTPAPESIALAEVYDAGAPPARLVNLSARANVGTGSDILIAGFGVTGSTSETVLLRAVGPGLASTFGLGGILYNPVLTLYDSALPAKVIAKNTGWGNAPSLGNPAVITGIEQASGPVMSEVGAFSLSAGSADSSLIATLPPGSYTVQVTGLNSGTGDALVEIYEVP